MASDSQSQQSSSDPADGGRSEPETEVVFPWMRRYGAQGVDAARIAPCFSSPLCVRRVLKDVAQLLQRIEEVEPLHLENTRYHFTQLFSYLHARPSRENGTALMRWVDGVRRSLDFRHSWPKEPLADERLGTILEGVEQIIFNHSSQGLIRLHWMNPLPTPAWLQHGGYQCDVCFNPDLRAGYQHVDEDNARDHSRLLEQRTGYDACAKCAAARLSEFRDAVRNWSSIRRNVGVLSTFRQHGGEEKLCFSVSGVEDTLTVDVEVRGTIGHHIVVAAIPKDSDLPAGWFGTGRNVMRQSAKPRTAEPTSKIVEFRCESSGNLFKFAVGEKRGCLRCWALPKKKKTFGREQSINHLSFVQREDRGAIRLAWRKGPAGEGATLPSSQLEELRLLANWAGCLNNLPAPASSPTQKHRSDAEDAIESFARHGPGVKGAFLEREDLEGMDCAICLGGLCEQTWVRGPPVKTRCGHYFHDLCLRRHFRSSAKEGGSEAVGACPNCRAPTSETAVTCGEVLKRWRIEEDFRGQPFRDGCYRFLAVLCADPEAVVDSSIVMAQTVHWVSRFPIGQPVYLG